MSQWHKSKELCEICGYPKQSHPMRWETKKYGVTTCDGKELTGNGATYRPSPSLDSTK
jgi:hypothetical protein